MDSDRQSIINSARRAALDMVRPASEEATAVFVKLHNYGSGPSQVAAVLEHAYRRACDAAANRLAEICQGEAPGFADDLDQTLAGIEPVFSEPMANMNFMHGKATNDLNTLRGKLGAIREDTIADLRLGIAGGANVDKAKSRIISIDNRGGSAQVAIDSPQAQQKVGRDLRNDASIGDTVTDEQVLRGSSMPDSRVSCPGPVP